MPPKRGNNLQLDGHEEQPTRPSKKQRTLNGAKGKHRDTAPATDLTYGQRYVFSTLDEPTVPSDEDLEFEDEHDALSYLKAVRQEASGIPHLLVATKAGPQLPAPPTDELRYDDGQAVDRSLYYTGVGDTGGYYSDGTYTAAPGEQLEDDPMTGTRATDDEKRLSEAYFTSITAQFNQLRRILYRQPPASALAALSVEHDTEVGPLGPKSKTFVVWRGRLLHTDPAPAQVAAMDKGSVLRLLRIILNGKFLHRASDVSERTSRWLWALLARLPDRGELDSGEISWVRELGKRAVLMMTSIAEVAALREQVELDEGDGSEFADEEGDAEAVQGHGQKSNGAETAASEDVRSVSDKSAPMEEDSASEDGEVLDNQLGSRIQEANDDIEAVKARLLTQLDSVEDALNIEPEIQAAPQGGTDEEEEMPYDAERAQVNMRATINMILTVAGEFYGQRDLLEFRDPFTGLQ